MKNFYEETSTYFSFLESPDKCKKHWKNVRDRYVKVKHMRDKHFQKGGTELNAPAKYVYFEHLEFMREFSLKKDILFDDKELFTAPSVSPDQLLYEISKDSQSHVTLCDYTSQFIEAVKDHPELYDDHSELRRYRSKDAWKHIAEAIGGRFSVGQLRSYWIHLMKKYNVYLDNYHKYHGVIENEDIFDQLSFTSLEPQGKHKQFSSFTDVETTKEDQSCGEEEYLETEEQEDAASDFEVEMDASSLWIAELESRKRKRESESEEPVLKKQPVAVSFLNESPVKEPQKEIIEMTVPKPSEKEDEFYHKGKALGLQLGTLFKELAQRDRKLARKAEIKVLQLILELEEDLDS